MMSLLTLIRRIYYVLFFLTSLIMFSATSELFEFNKMMLIYACAIVISALWLIHLILNRKSHLYMPFLWAIYLIFFVSQFLATVFSIDIHTSLFGYYGRFNGGLLSIIAYLSLFFVFVNTFDRATLMRLLKVSFVASLVVMIWGLPGRFGHDLSCLLFTGQFNNSCWTDQFQPAVRMFSTLGQPNWLGAYLVIHFFIGLYFWFVEMLKQAKLKLTPQVIFYTLYLVVSFSCILFTRSRSSLGALIVLLLIFPVLYFFSSKKKESVIVLKKYCLLLVLFLVPLFIFKTGIDRVDHVFTVPGKKAAAPKIVTPTAPTSSEPTESFDIRKIVWKGAVDLGFKYPFFGTGVETFAYSYYFTRPQEHNLTSEWDFLYNKAHNEYLNYFATTGSLGLAAYIVLIGYVVVLFYRGMRLSGEDHEEETIFHICLLLSYLSILTTNFFGFSTTTTSLFFFLIPGFVYAYLKNELPQADYESFFQVIKIKKFQAVFIAVFGAWLLLGVIRMYAADIQYERSLNATRAAQYGQAAVFLQSALSLHNEHVYKDKLSYTLANLAFVAAYQKDASTSAKIQSADITDKYVQLAQYFNAQSLKESPKNVLYYKTISKNNYLFYQIYLDPKYLVEAIAAMEKARTLSPTDPKLPYTSALFYSLLTDETTLTKTQIEENKRSSLEAIDQALALKSDYRDAYFLKGQLLKKYGRSQEAQAIFEFILKTFDPHDQEVLKELGK